MVPPCGTFDIVFPVFEGEGNLVTLEVYGIEVISVQLRARLPPNNVGVQGKNQRTVRVNIVLFRTTREPVLDAVSSHCSVVWQHLFLWA
jgi:hypothetical protein